MSSKHTAVLFLVFAAGLPWAASAAELSAQDDAVIHSLLKTVGSATLDLPSGAPFTLQQTLTETYQRNPDIQAARAELRATDEAHTQALAGFRPTLTGEADYQTQREQGDITDDNGNEKNLSLQLTQSLYSGGSTRADIAAADSKILAQRALLRATEQQTLLNAVTAYMDVLRDQEIALLTVNNETTLAEQMKASQERFRLGDITLTDIKQSENRLAEAIASRLAAQASLKKSKANFESIVWVQPSNVQPTDVDATLPATLDEAVTEAEKNNPNNIFSKNAIDEAKATTRSLTGTKLPQLDLTGQVGRSYGPIDFPDDKLDTGAVILRATFPFYSGGRTDSLIRQSRETESQRRIEKYRTGRSVRQTVIEAWQDLEATKEQSVARKIQIDAAKTARDGVKSEADYGTRTTLDVLDAEREYLNAQVNYAGVEHDRIVSVYRLIAAMGDLMPENLKLEVASYDTAAHYNKVKNAWFGTKIGDSSAPPKK